MRGRQVVAVGIFLGWECVMMRFEGRWTGLRTAGDTLWGVDTWTRLTYV